MLKSYKPLNRQETFRTLREVVQNIVLLGLYRRGFFNVGLFYGGTALRILYGLKRFSEDLDFSLFRTDTNFDLRPYMDSLQKELSSFGLQTEIRVKKSEGQIKSAFLKTNTQTTLLLIDGIEKILGDSAKQLKIRLEIDTDPPESFSIESKIVYKPIPFSVITMTKPSLFAGKVHAVLCRKWQTRIKGRDWFDFIWYIGEKTLLDIKHLKARMVQTNHFDINDELNKERVKELLHDRIDAVDFENAKIDVIPFVKDIRIMDSWNKDFFHGAVADMLFINS